MGASFVLSFSWGPTGLEGEWAHGIWFRVEWWSRPHYNGRPMHGCKKDLKGEPHSLITHHSSPPLPFHLAYFESLTTLLVGHALPLFNKTTIIIRVSFSLFCSRGALNNVMICPYMLSLQHNPISSLTTIWTTELIPNHSSSINPHIQTARPL